MEWLMDNAWLVVVVPLGLSFVGFLLGRLLGRMSAWVAMIGPLTVLTYGISAVTEVLSAHGATPPSPFVGAVVSEKTFEWMVAGDAVIASGYVIDGLSAIMLMVVGTVALMVMLFSVGYMHGDQDYPRYFATLSMFTASMTILVVASDLVGLFLGWELVGLCSYLLIGFWYHKPSASAAAMKAFLVTRVGDIGFLLGLAWLWKEAGTLELMEIMQWAGVATASSVALAAGLLFMGAAGKSAQFPLHLWLPDAMEGPTPVSALIHAATMVAAGVFLLARTWPLFAGADTVRMIILVLAAITALGAALVAVAQTDIKKVLAYSTISQLGFMFAALGVGAWRVAMFHLVTHAAFKGLLFLASGSVIHGTGTQDMRLMGGLSKKMPVTAVTWFLGVGALAGIPPLAGFFSKDEVVASVLHEAPIAGLVLVVASLVTAFYAFRATRLTFSGTYRGDGQPHEGGFTMKVPLIVLAAGAASLGFIGHPLMELLGGEAEALDPMVAAISVAIALAGAVAGWGLYKRGPEGDSLFADSIGPLWRAVGSAYGYDGAVMRWLVAPTVGVARVVFEVLDRLVFDGIAEGAGSLMSLLGRSGRRIQSGDAQWYVALMGAGVIVLFAVSVWVVR